MPRAILYVPGSSQHLLDQSAPLIADRISRGIRDRLIDEMPFRYRVTTTSDAHKLASGIGLDRAAIEVASGESWLPVLDIFELKYLENFTSPFGGQPALARGIWAGKLVFAHLPSAIRAIGRSGTPKGGLDKMQATFLGLIVLVSLAALAYWILIGALGVFGITEIFDGTRAKDDKWLAIGAVLAAGLTAGRFALKDFVEALEKSAIEFYSIIAYISDGRRFAAVPGSISDAIQYVKAQGYDEVDLLSFSLGGLLAADAIWPRGPQLRSERQEIVNWITIGHPYDLIASTYPQYFADRRSSSISISRWMNVVASDDFLGSNFRRDEEKEEPAPDLGIQVVEPTARIVAPDHTLYFTPSHGWRARSPLDVLPFRRVLNHTLYWDEKDAFAPTCFGDLAQQAGWIDVARAVAPRY